MITLKATKWAGLLGVVLAAFHYTSHGYLFVETKLLSHFRETQLAVVEGLARDFGFEKPKQVSAADIYSIAQDEAMSRGINPALVRALLHVESSGNAFAVSPVGAIGVMQIMPFNIKRCGLSHYGELFDARKNIRCGVKIFSEELASAGGDPDRAIQTYNGGPKCFNRCEESIKHSRLVLARLAKDIS